MTSSQSDSLTDVLPTVPACSFSPAERTAQILAHQSYVSSMAHHFHPMFWKPAPDIADIEQVGTIGLIKAVDTFDPTLGIPLTTFAIHKIRGYILDFIAKNFPGTKQGLTTYKRIARASAELTRTLNRAPTQEDLATHFGLSVSNYIAFRDHAAPPSFYALNEIPTNTFKSRFRDIQNFPSSQQPDPQTLALKAELSQRLAAAITLLPPKQRQVLMLYIGRDYGVRQICQELHTDSRTVHKSIDRAIITLRAQLTGCQPSSQQPDFINQPLPPVVAARQPLPPQPSYSLAFA